MESISLEDGRAVTVRAESWPIAGAFTISRGAKDAAEVMVVEIADGGARGRGECVPYARYGESVAAVLAQIAEAARALGGRLSRETLAQALPPGAARNALDCALWDYEAKTGSAPVHALAGLDTPQPVMTAYTIGLGAPEDMAAKGWACGYPLLKLKLGGDGDEARLQAVRQAAPHARLIVDANEAWRADQLPALLNACAQACVELVE
jgi:L-alanine-DL-glutamate epimerase-like enolase superfamily enzyme